MWMKAGQVAPRGPRGIGYRSQASLKSRLLVLPIFESNIGVRVFTRYVWSCNKFLQEYLTAERRTMKGAEVHSLQVVWLTAVSFGTCAATLPSPLKPAVAHLAVHPNDDTFRLALY